MDASEHFKAGRLDEAIELQLHEVKTHPLDQARRLFLFELLAFAGDLDRAGRQIEAIHYDELELQAALATYRTLLDSERARRRLFDAGERPKFFGPPPEHVQRRLEAIDRLREEDATGAAELLAQANEARPSARGQINGTPYEAIRDCDDLLGTVLEVEAHGDYFWIPLEQIDALHVPPPRFPRDLLWIPARLEMQGASGDVFLPALYAGSHESPDAALRLGRLTDWKTSEGGPALGVGLRLFLADEADIPILDWREFLAAEPPGNAPG